MNKFYTDEKNAQIVIALLKAHGISRVVVSPGATNIPIAGSIQNDPFFEIYSSVDERSAAYLACGIAYETGHPVVLSCTGATASRNYLPGLTEAWYRKLPIIAVTSTPSVVAVGHLAPQCIDRSMLPCDTARLSVTLSHVKDNEDFWDCEVKVNAAILEASRDGGGPVRINIPTAYKGTFNTPELPKVRAIRRVERLGDIPAFDAAQKVAVFIGSHKPYSHTETDALEQFVRTHNAIVLCDHTSSYKEAGRVLSALACLQNLPARPTFAELKPDLIIHLGEVSGDYPTHSFLTDSHAPVWRVSEDGQLRDLFRRLEYVFEMREADFFQNLSAELEPRENLYLKAWQDYRARIKNGIPELPFSNTWIASQLAGELPVNSVLHFGILNSLRNWNLFEIDPSIQTACNVGGFGIDGCVSSLIGASLVNKEKLYFGVIGDLSFFYDLNAIGNRHLGSNLRLLMVNNGGGVEFELKSHIGAQFEEHTGDFIAASGHFGNKSPTLVKHMAEDLGFKYLSANNKEAFMHGMEAFTAASTHEKPILFECFTKAAEEADALDAIGNIDTTHLSEPPPPAAHAGSELLAKGLKGTVNIAKHILPQGVKDAIKRSLR